MSQFVEVNAVGLTGPTLDWAVAKVIGHPADWEQSSGCLWFESNDHEWLVWSPSTDWAQGGPLIDKYRIQLTPHGNIWEAQTDLKMGPSFWARQFGTTPLIALCRAIVDAKLGGVVKIPSELVVPS